MATLEEHPTVKQFRARTPVVAASAPASKHLTAAWLKQLALECGADDAGVVEIERAELAEERGEMERLLPHAKAVLSLVCRMNRDDIRTPARSIANLEFHHQTDEVNEVARRVVAALEREGVRALNPSAGFPMEADRWGTKIWVVSHKTVAVAAGLGHMGIHRNVIHPRFGNFILLGTVIIDAAIDAPSAPIDYNPCLECKLCVAACPTGAIGADGHFDFMSCYTHNYREFMGGFSDWVDTIVESDSPRAYRERVSDAETVSMWQSLSYGSNYKAAYCMAVCPAGEEVIAPFLTNRKQYLQDVVKPLQDKRETVYVLRGSDAQGYVARRYPHKLTKVVANGQRTPTIQAFLRGVPIAFQREQAGDLAATYHFRFTGPNDVRPAAPVAAAATAAPPDDITATIVIRDKTVTVTPGLVGTPDLRVAADGVTWLRVLAKEQSMVWALLRRKIRLQGSPRLLLKFGRCFAS